MCSLVADVHFGGIAQVVGLLAHMAVLSLAILPATAWEIGLNDGLE